MKALWQTTTFDFKHLKRNYFNLFHNIPFFFNHALSNSYTEGPKNVEAQLCNKGSIMKRFRVKKCMHDNQGKQNKQIKSSIDESNVDVKRPLVVIEKPAPKGTNGKRSTDNYEYTNYYFYLYLFDEK